MLGKPKYELDERVKFVIDGKVKHGYVFIIDKYGTFFDNSDVSYDIMVESDNILYKHIREDALEADDEKDITK